MIGEKNHTQARARKNALHKDYVEREVLDTEEVGRLGDAAGRMLVGFMKDYVRERIPSGVWLKKRAVAKSTTAVVIY